MKLRTLLSATGITLLAWIPAARAEHFVIQLLASSSGGAKQQSYADQSPPAAGVNPRPVLRARAGELITVQFIMTNAYPHGSIANAGVRYYVVKETRAGQHTVPDLSSGVVSRGEFTLNLKPKARIGARFQVSIAQRGDYLLRVESLRTQNTHEHFSAIDLEVR